MKIKYRNKIKNDMSLRIIHAIFLNMMNQRSYMRHWEFASLTVFFAFSILFLSANPIFAQTDVEASEQTTLSEDLANDPVAQDILKKIEQTKKWIAELEQRNYEKLQVQEELEAKRAQALEILNQDLKEWEKLWEEYSPRNSFGRFVEKIPSSPVQGVFWDQFEYHEMKVNAGREALKKVIANGGSLSEARVAYHKAAETTRIELIEANSIFNVKHNLAYYNQQILFNKEGQFIETPITGEQLRKYYEDYRTNPAYLAANPDDVVSWEELGKTNPNTECREGYVVVYRYQTSDYVCVTTYTAEMWIRYGMGEISGNSATTQSPDYSVTPLTKCNEVQKVIFVTETGKYSCVLEDTANEWIEQGIAEFHDAQSYISEQINDKDTSLRIISINDQIQEFETELDAKILELKKTYDIKYEVESAKSKQEEKNATKDFNERSGMTKEELSRKILSIRKQYESQKEDLLREKMEALKNLEESYKNKMKEFASSYDFDQYIKMVWNSAKSSYEAVPRN